MTDRRAAEPATAAVGAAGKMLAERGIFGMAWLDERLIVRTCYGRLIDFIAIGRPVSDTVLPLVGLEDDIRALRAEPGAVLELPSVAIVLGERTTPRFNISIFWFADAGRYLLLVSRAVSRSDLEAQLSTQMRARLIAEAEVKAKSQELARANAELSRANRDLEDFASIIAHDLAGPMRSMRYLTDELEAALHAPGAGGAAVRADDAKATAEAATAPRPRACPTGDAGCERADELLQKLRAQAARLSSMLRDLHEYSSIGRKVDALEKTDTRALVDAVVNSVHRGPTFSITVTGHWPHLTTLAAPLDLVLRNLIENAVKHHDRPDGHVSVTADIEGDALSIVVADDGPGIDARNQDAVFMPFRTLGRHGAGTGMGLAFVKRTVESVGGRLSLVSHPETRRGSQFRILWPRTLTF